MRIDILSLFPEYFTGPLDVSMIKRAQEKGLISIELTNIRDFADNAHRRVDDRPYGGGPGMVLMAEPVVKAVRSKKKEGSRVIYLSPQGKRLDSNLARSLADEEHLIFISGHYEGIDERAVVSVVDEEISIGDYVLTNGCLAALVVMDALIRFIPGVLGDETGADNDSFEGGLLDCPHYTRPEEFEGLKIPPVLLSGDHKSIATWRKMAALEKTVKQRPDLLKLKN